MAVKRLTAKQTAALRSVVERSLAGLKNTLFRAQVHPKSGEVDPKEVEFYTQRITEVESALASLPVRGGVEIEDDISDEQRDEEED
jgi:hypothetical protein